MLVLFIALKVPIESEEVLAALHKSGLAQAAGSIKGNVFTWSSNVIS